MNFFRIRSTKNVDGMKSQIFTNMRRDESWYQRSIGTEGIDQNPQLDIRLVNIWSDEIPILKFVITEKVNKSCHFSFLSKLSCWWTSRVGSQSSPNESYHLEHFQSGKWLEDWDQDSSTWILCGSSTIKADPSGGEKRGSLISLLDITKEGLTKWKWLAILYRVTVHSSQCYDCGFVIWTFSYYKQKLKGKSDKIIGPDV
jgi:hypothetical protein